MRTHTSRWLSDAAEADEHLAVGRLRIGNVLVPQDVRPAVLVDPDRLHGQNPLMTAAELARAAEELGIDVDRRGARPRHTTRPSGTSASAARAACSPEMKFTMARPEVSCHPELLLDGARTVVSAALCYWVDGPSPPPGEGRLPRYAWRDHYALLRERLDELGRRLGGALPRARRREPARRPRRSAARRASGSTARTR